MANLKQSDICAYSLLTNPNTLVSPLGFECVFYLASILDPANMKSSVVYEQLSNLSQKNSPIELMAKIMDSAGDIQFESFDLVAYGKDTQYGDMIKSNPALKSITQKTIGSDTKAMCSNLNALISKKTNNLVNNFFNERQFDNVQLLILNIIYFLGKWDQAFNKNGKITKQWNNKKTIQLMAKSSCTYPYLETDKYQVIELPYKNKDFVFGIILKKDNGSFSSNSDELQLIQTIKPSTKIHLLAIPKFEIKCTVADDQIRSVYKYSGLTSCKQETVIKVNEEGTEAVAVTSFMTNRMMTTPVAQIDFIADKPFIYYIKYIPTNSILFLGRMDDPIIQ